MAGVPQTVPRPGPQPCRGGSKAKALALLPGTSSLQGGVAADTRCRTTARSPWHDTGFQRAKPSPRRDFAAKPAHESKLAGGAGLPFQGRAVTPPAAGRARMLAGSPAQPSPGANAPRRAQALGGQQGEGEGKLDSLTLSSGQLNHPAFAALTHSLVGLCLLPGHL